MASKNIVAKGTTYNGVESVTFPVSGGGNATFYEISDTTAVAADVDSSKWFYTALGVLTQGTASGGGGASNVVRGTFTASSNGGAAQTISVPYSGNGYPIACFVYPTNGFSDPSVGNLIQQYAIPVVYINKTNINSDYPPTYSTSGSQNQGQVVVRYKNMSTSPSSYATGASLDANTYSSDSATDSSRTLVVRFTSDTTLSVFIASSSYGLIPSVEYTYIIEYSE